MLLTHNKTTQMLRLITFPPIFSTLSINHRFYSALTHGSPPVRRNASPSTTTKTGASATAVPVYQLPPTSAYVHLPFCRKRCHYCDFPIVALGTSSSLSSSSPTQNDGVDDPRIVNYIQSLCREIAATKPESGTTLPLQTVFFGGGTPSLVPPRLVSTILNALKMQFEVSMDAEISMEMDPGTFDGKKMEELVEMVGVNRVSLGVQAFQEELLKACGRAHGLKEVYDGIEIVKACDGVRNWSLDLISSLPHQSFEMWEESLRLAVQAEPTHVSVYDLQVEQGTKFGNLYNPGVFPLPSETQSASFYKMASKALSDANYNHYEISSYSKTGFECKHNLTYWANKPFYAFGLGAASYLKGLRFSRPKKMKEYMNYVQDLENGAVTCHGSNLVDAKDMAMDVVMLSLRTSRGLDLKCFAEEFGGSLVLDLCKVYREYVESGHVVCLDDKKRVVRADEFNNFLLLKEDDEIAKIVRYIRLSDPDGFLLSNELISLAFGAISP